MMQICSDTLFYLETNKWSQDWAKVWVMFWYIPCSCENNKTLFINFKKNCQWICHCQKFTKHKTFLTLKLRQKHKSSFTSSQNCKSKPNCSQVGRPLCCACPSEQVSYLPVGRGSDEPHPMRVGNHSELAFNSASLTDLKTIRTPHSLFRDFQADTTFTTRWSGGRVQVWAQVWVPAGHLAIIPEDYFRKQSKVLTAKSRAELLGPCSGTAWAGLRGKHKHRASAAVAAGCDQLSWGNSAALLQHWLSFKELFELMICKFYSLRTVQILVIEDCLSFWSLRTVQLSQHTAWWVTEDNSFYMRNYNFNGVL